MFRRAFLLTQRLTWLTYWHLVLCLEGCNVNVLVPHLYKSATLKTFLAEILPYVAFSSQCLIVPGTKKLYIILCDYGANSTAQK